MLSIPRQINKFTNRIFNNRAHILQDLSLAARHAWTIPLLASPWNSESLTQSELHPNSYNNWGDVINLSLQTIVPLERRTYSPGTIACYPEHYAATSGREKWFFINGICTSPPIANLNGLV